ncbi:MAG: tetratricopeptide repeat protein [Syntrophales bacterium]|nr:tetratricopeptide repeat protein [Syntrophales bacterium]
MSDTSIKKVYVLLDSNGGSLQEFEKHFAGLFPCLDISSDIYLLSEDISQDFSLVKGTIKQVALFLERYPFYRINIHPVHPFPLFHPGRDIYHDLFQITAPFNREGYLHQSVSRIMILPVLAMERKDRNNLKQCSQYLDFLRDRLIIPSIYISGVPPSGIGNIVKSDRERVYLELTEGEKLERIANTLGIHSVFDDLAIWANDPVKGDLLPGCRSVILKRKDGNIYNCFKAFFLNKPVLSLYADRGLPLSQTLKAAESKRSDCLNCSVESLALMKDTLRINEREREAGVISFHLGMALVKREDYDGALKQFDQVPENQGGTEDRGTILLSRALCHLRRNEVGKAMAALDEAERYLPSSVMIYYYRGLCEFGLRDYIEAIDRFNDALRLGADQLPLGDVYFYLGLSHVNIEEYEDGLVMMNRAEEFFTNKSPVYYYMGICHLGMQKLEIAIDYLRNALAGRPSEEDLGSIYLHLGLCYKEMGRYEDAIAELKKAGDSEEGRKDVHNLMGYCYFKLKEHDQAIVCFLKAVEIDPNSAIDYANIGVNLKEKGETERAVLMFQKALSMDPTIGFARRHLNEINPAL